MIKILILSIIAVNINTFDTCPQSDQSCISCLNSKCNICIGTYFNKLGYCQQPIITVNKCLTYGSDQKCSYCKYGYYLSPINTCEEITQSNCLQVDSNMNCTMCMQGILLKDGICDPKNLCQTKKCKYCSLYQKKERCIECLENYFIYIVGDQPVCKYFTVQEQQNCWIVSQKDPTKCAVCKINYYYQDGNCI